MTKLIPYIKRNIIPIIGLFAGFGAGYLYWLLIGCNTGTCPITSVWYRSALYGAIMGWLVAGLFKKEKSGNKD